MGKVDTSRYGSRTPKLVPEDLEGGEFIVLTVAEFGEQTFEDEEGKRVTPYLAFEETGEKVLWLNQTQVGYLIERLGDESDAWKGMPVPIEHHTSTFRGRKHDKLWIMPPERWDDALAEAGLAPKRARRVASVRGKSPAKKGGKKRGKKS